MSAYLPMNGHGLQACLKVSEQLFGQMPLPSQDHTPRED